MVISPAALSRSGADPDSAADRSDATVAGYFFADDAPAFVERQAPAWRAWLERLAVPAT